MKCLWCVMVGFVFALLLCENLIALYVFTWVCCCALRIGVLCCGLYLYRCPIRKGLVCGCVASGFALWLC